MKTWWSFCCTGISCFVCLFVCLSVYCCYFCYFLLASTLRVIFSSNSETLLSNWLFFYQARGPKKCEYLDTYLHSRANVAFLGSNRQTRNWKSVSIEMTNCSSVWSALNMRWTCDEHAMNIRWTCDEHALSMRWTCAENALSMRWTCAEHALSTRWTRAEHALNWFLPYPNLLRTRLATWFDTHSLPLGSFALLRNGRFTFSVKYIIPLKTHAIRQRWNLRKEWLTVLNNIYRWSAAANDAIKNTISITIDSN